MSWSIHKKRNITYSLLQKDKELARSFIESLSDKELTELKYDWSFWARDEQLPPLEWIRGKKYIWILRCGRGWGKTRTACQTVIEAIKTGVYKRISICGATAEEVRDIMIEGESGLASCCPPELCMDYRPSIKKIFFKGGVTVSLFYGSEPEKSRGAQSEFLWCDELHKWKYPEATFDNLLLGLRLGDNPLCLVTSTPKPTAFTRDIEKLKNNEGESACVITVGSTYSNKSNLSSQFFNTIITKYEGTRLALQELEGQILDDNPNALFKREWIEYNAVSILPSLYNQTRTIIAIDPAITHSQKTSDYTGIIVIMQGKAPVELVTGEKPSSSDKEHFYILYDGSLIGTPFEWSSKVKYLTEMYKANECVVEDNQGGDMTEATLINAGVTIPIKRVHSSQNKEARAMQASILAEQGRLHFYIDEKNINDDKNLDILESELCNWVPGSKKSPDRLDALAHGINYLNADSEIFETEEEKQAKSILRKMFMS
ncbi:MAG: terminase large subunit domain-containing protein [Treponema sp.]